MPPATPPHIGIFDSGIGGLSVLRALRHALPQARYTYIADSRHTPWGDRAPGWIVARSLQLSAVLLAEHADLVLVACNTATTLAIGALRARWPAGRFVGVEPGIKPAAAASRSGRVAVLATSATLGSARLDQLVGSNAMGASVLRLPCPGLVEAIEKADPDDETLNAMLNTIAEALLAARIDAVVLGCTHYPLVAEALAQRLGPDVLLVDTAQAVARRVAQLLGLADTVQSAQVALVAQSQQAAAGMLAPLPRLLATGSPDTLQRAARRWIAEDARVERLPLADPPDPA
jgi:glutamate racemase